MGEDMIDETCSTHMCDAEYIYKFSVRKPLWFAPSMHATCLFGE
jgi:hypothetical protein